MDEGYRLDEEITHAVVPAMLRSGLPTLPMLPSGLVYLRGLPYSYAAHLSGAVFGQTLPTYRRLSLAFALLGIVAVFLAGRAAATPTVGAAAAMLLALLPSYVAVAAFARPYSLFLAVFSWTLWIFFRVRAGRARDAWFVAGVVACRLLHEFGLALMLLPVLSASAARTSPERGRFLQLSVKVAIAVAVLEVVTYSVVQHSLTTLFEPLSQAPAFRPVRTPAIPPHLWSSVTPLSFLLVVALPLGLLSVVLFRRTQAWFVIAICAVLGALSQLGPIVAVVCVAILVRPWRGAAYAAIGALVGGVSAVAWVVHTFLRTYVQPSWSAARSLAAGGMHYPFSVMVYVGEQWPAIATAALLGTATFMYREWRGESVVAQRTLASFVAVVLLGFTVLGVSLQLRFLLLVFPALFVLAAVGFQETSLALGRLLARGVRVREVLAAAILAAFVAFTAWQNAHPEDETLRSIRLTERVEPDDVVICTEELACEYLLGRVDYLWLVSAEDLSYYAGLRGGELRGLYAGTPVVSAAGELESLIARRPERRHALVILKTGKVDDGPMLDIAADLSARHASHTSSTTDAMVVYLDPVATGSSTPTGSEAARQR